MFNPEPGGGTSNARTFTIYESPAPAPNVSSIAPSEARNKGAVSVTITGDGFLDRATVTLTKPGTPPIEAADVEVVSSTSIRSRLELKGASPGVYAVTVTNPDLKAGHLADAFTVKKTPTPPEPPTPPTPPEPTPDTSPTWYLAEGTSDYGFDTFVNIENPNDTAVTALVTYMTESGPRSRAALVLPPMSQTTINPRNDIGAADFSTKVECKERKTIVVDRRMTWWGAGAASQEGTSSIGITAPAKTWFLPEGSSKWGFETWLLIQNPNDSDANCTVTYMTEGSGPRRVEKSVPANSRASFNMETDIGLKDASIKIESNVPVIPERAMYRNNRREGHVSAGTTTPAKDYYLAEGTTSYGFTTYVLIQNPNDRNNTVTVTYMMPGGARPQEPIVVPANSRRTIRVNDVLRGVDLSTRVSGSLPLIAERAMYWGEGSPLGEACHDSIGMDAPHKAFYFPDGETQGGYETWTLVQNPNDKDVDIEVSYLPAGGGAVETVKATVPANSRMTFDMKDKVPDGRAAILVTSKTTGGKIMCERAMYWSNRGAGTDTIGGYSD